MAQPLVDLPSSVEEVTPRWLGGVLNGSGALAPGDRISSVRHQCVGEGIGLMSELHRVSYRSVAGSEGSVVVKLSSENELRSTADQLGLYQREIDFYRYVAGTAPVRTPQVHLALQAEGSTNFVLVLEDLAGLKAADQLAGLSLPAAEAAIDAVAGLHAWVWADERRLAELCGHFSSIRCELTELLYPTYFGAGWANYVALAEHEPGEVLRAVASRWVDVLPWFLEELATPTTFCHGDYRADNLFFDAANDSVVVIDFQLAHQGCGISDIAYLASQSVDGIDVEDHQRLVRHYCSALAARGVGYPWPEAWRQYRIAVLFHLVEAVVATLTWPSLDGRGRQLVLRLVERAARAIEVTGAHRLLPP